jgi:hypothetical protein
MRFSQYYKNSIAGYLVSIALLNGQFLSVTTMAGTRDQNNCSNLLRNQDTPQPGTGGHNKKIRSFEIPNQLIGQLIDEELYVHALPRPLEVAAANNLLSVVQSSFQTISPHLAGGWIFQLMPTLRMKSNSKDKSNLVVVAIAGWKTKNVPANGLFRKNQDAIEVTPDWICEILWDSTAELVRGYKKPMYAKYGVKQVWILNPEVTVLETYTLNSRGKWDGRPVFAKSQNVSAEPFDAIEFGLDQIWAIPGSSTGK